MIFTNKQIEYLSKIECDSTEIILMLNSVCNADCKTCILKQNIYNKELCLNCAMYTSKKHSNCYSGEIDDNKYMSRVKYLLNLFKDKNLIITITGGEPTLCDNRLLDTIKLCANDYKNCIQKITLETNGANLTQQAQNIKNLLNNVPYNILLNRYALDDTLNSRAFQFKYKEILNKDIKMFVENDLPIDIRCIMHNSCIDTINDAYNFYEYYKNLGVNNISFVTPLMDTFLQKENASMCDYVNTGLPTFISTHCNDLLLIYSSNSTNIFNTIKYQDLIIIDNTEYNNNTMQHNNKSYSQYMLYSNGNIGTTMKEDRHLTLSE